MGLILKLMLLATVITNNESDRDISFITGHNQLSLIDDGAGGKQAVIGGATRRSVDEVQLTVEMLLINVWY